MEWVLPLRHEALTPIFLALTALGDTLFYLVATAAAYWLGDRPVFRRLAFLVTLTALLNSWLKAFFAVPRPTAILWLAEADGYSFPSGHAQLAAFSWLWLALEFPRKKWLWALAPLLIFGISASRVYLGVHTPRDVAAGILIGALTVVAAWRPAHLPPALWLRLPPAARFLAWAFLLALIFVFFPGQPDHVAVVAAGSLLGFQLGFLVEGDAASPLHRGWRRIAAVAFGLAVALLIRIAGKILFQQLGLIDPVGDFLRYFLIAVWVVWLAPRSFAACRLATR